MENTIKIKRIDPNDALPLPSYATKRSAGLDLYAANDEDIIISPGEVKIISTGIAISLPNGFEAQIRPRSGLAAKHGVTVLNSPGTIDADYRGEIKVVMINHGTQDFIVEKATRIAQMVIAKYEAISWQEVESLETTQRGEQGFGSTGYK